MVYRITTTKFRVIGNKTQMLRVDDEVTDDLAPNDQSLLLGKINEMGTAVVVATHNYSLIPRIPGARLMQLDNGEIVSISS